MERIHITIKTDADVHLSLVMIHSHIILNTIGNIS